jgi:hypothetical protein
MAPVEINVQEMLYQLFGAGDETTYAALAAKIQNGLTLSDVLTAAESTLSGNQTADVTGQINTHDANAAAHASLVRWLTAGQNGKGIYVQSTSPPTGASEQGNVWIQT